MYKDKETISNCSIDVNCHKNRKRKIIWFNKWCVFVNLFINIRKYFKKLIDKQFNQYNILYKIFNRKTLKISYSCTNILKKIINTHNTEVIRKYYDQLDDDDDDDDDSKTKINSPINGFCNLKNVVYQAIIFPKKNVKKKKLYWNFVG